MKPLQKFKINKIKEIYQIPLCEIIKNQQEKMNNIPKRIFLHVGDLDDSNIDFDELRDVTWSAERIYKNDVEYILKPAKDKKSVMQMAKETNGRSRACDICSLFMKCNMVTQKICSDAFIEGYIKGYKQGKKG